MLRDLRHCTIYYNHYGEYFLLICRQIIYIIDYYCICELFVHNCKNIKRSRCMHHACSRRTHIFITIFQIFRASFESKFWSIIIISQLGTARHSISKYLFNLVTCIYKHNININIMVINNTICRANLAYNVTLYTDIANKHTRIQCAEEANITDINRSFSLTTPYTKNSVFLSNISRSKK